jgi:SH3-like domain-containing protein|tara:strand:- start:752 stop:1210 length:459 start_codon:yes stop_codon:yes gene_type:complete
MYRILFFLFLILFNQIHLNAKETETFLMLKNNKVNVRYGPSFDYPIKYFYQKKFLTVRIIDKKENWRKIIDHKKNSGWIHASQLKRSKSFILNNDEILFTKPLIYSRPIAKIENGRLILFQKCKKLWCKVKVNKFEGWLNSSNIWGKIATEQ